MDGNFLGSDFTGFPLFAKAIGRSKLAMLGLSKNGIVNDQFKDLLAAISMRNSRISLDISDNLIGDGIEHLGKIISKQKVQLFEINVRGNSIPNGSLDRFSNHLKDCKGGIRELNLSKNNIPLKTGFLLLQACVDNNTGIRINLEDNPDCAGYVCLLILFIYGNQWKFCFFRL